MTSYLKNLAFAFIAVLTCVSFSSCNDDNKDELTPDKFLIGIWTESWYEDIIEIKSDGSGYYAESLDDTEVAPFYWTYKNDMLTCVKDSGETEEAKLINKSENKILWKHYVNNPNAYDPSIINKDNYGYYYMWTWVRYTK